ncbi:MAG: Putative cytochrome P450 hydroxylase, partial [uncultured Acetobacteraceae bacterium]
ADPRLRHRPVLRRLLRGPFPRARGASRSRPRGPPVPLRRPRLRAPRRGEGDPGRLAHLLLRPRRRAPGLRQGEALPATVPGAGNRPAAARPHAQGPGARALAGRHRPAARDLRRGGRGDGGSIGRAGRVRRGRRPRRSLPAHRLPRRHGDAAGEPRPPAALRQHGLQQLRPAQRLPGASRRRRARGRGLGVRAVEAREPGARGLRRRHPRRGRHRRPDRGGNAAGGALRPHRRRGHDRERHRRRHLLPRPLPRAVRPAARRARPRPQRLRGGRAPRNARADLLPHHDARHGDRRRVGGRRREGADVPRRRQPRPAALGKAGRVRHRPPRRGPRRLRQRHPRLRRHGAGAAGRGVRPRRPGAARGAHRDHRRAAPALQQHAARAGEPAGAAGGDL